MTAKIVFEVPGGAGALVMVLWCGGSMIIKSRERLGNVVGRGCQLMVVLVGGVQQPPAESPSAEWLVGVW